MITISNDTAWCPGCGNFAILDSLKNALSNLELPAHKVVLSSGIGQAAKTPQYIGVNMFNGLHGRSIPAGLAIKLANKDLTVIVESGDGCSYGEGGNHFIHAVRRNLDITHIVHNNQIYGLTKGQASPTTTRMQKTELQFDGVLVKPLNPISLALGLGAGFVARCFSGDKEHLTAIIEKAIKFKGYALIDIMQPCPSFNRTNTFKWYKDRLYYLPEDYDKTNLANARLVADEWGDKIPVGIIYESSSLEYISENTILNDNPPLVDLKLDPKDVLKFMKDFK